MSIDVRSKLLLRLDPMMEWPTNAKHPNEKHDTASHALRAGR